MQDRSKQIGYWLLTVAGVVFLMIAVGGLTRLTQSGLSMTEWKPIMGTLPPLSEVDWQEMFDKYQQSPEYKKVNQGMSMDDFRSIFWFEYGHRVLGRFIGLIFAVPFVYFLIRRAVKKSLIPRLVLLFFLGGMQGVIGWWMVKSGLTEDASVSQYRLATHLGIALVIFSLLIWTALDILYGKSQMPRGHAAATIGLVSITILAGALVAGLDAGLLYNEYPLMGSGLIPTEYGEQGFSDPFENPASAQFHHRWIAVLAVLSVVGLAFGAKKNGHTNAHRAAHVAIAMVSIQFILGITTLLHGVPVALGGLHQAGAVALLGSVIWLSHGLARAR